MQILIDSDLGSIAITRVSNGWLVRTDGRGTRDTEKGLAVAETPLAKMVTDWAQAQHNKANPLRPGANVAQEMMRRAQAGVGGLLDPFAPRQPI